MRGNATIVEKQTLISRARVMRKQPSRAERALWKLLRDRRLAGFKFRRQHPIARYVADFACITGKLVIEVDGLSHTVPDQADYDLARTADLNALGWHVLRVTDREVLSDEAGAIAKVLQALRHSPSPQPSPPLRGGEGA